MCKRTRATLPAAVLAACDRWNVPADSTHLACALARADAAHLPEHPDRAARVCAVVAHKFLYDDPPPGVPIDAAYREHERAFLQGCGWRLARRTRLDRVAEMARDAARPARLLRLVRESESVVDDDDAAVEWVLARLTLSPVSVCDVSE